MAEDTRQDAQEPAHGEWSEHASTYEGFTHMAFVGAFALVLVLVCLAVGALGGAWWAAGFGVLAVIMVTLGAVNNPHVSWRPYAAIFVVVMILYALTGG